jgi:hypothetical protein
MGSASRAISCLCCPCRCLFSCLCSILVSLAVTLGLLALALYLILKPRMIAATVDSASLSQFALSASSTLAYDLNVTMTVRNPNTRVGLYYDDVQALASYEGQRFGYAPLDAFYQGTGAATKLAPGFRGTQLLQGDVAAAQFRQQQSAGRFDVDVDLNAKLRVKFWAFKAHGPNAKITCTLSVPVPVPVPAASASPSPFQPTDCKVWF